MAARPARRIIWERADRPTRFVSDALGIERSQLRAALHQIKARSNLGGQDRVIIFNDGMVTDANGDEIGNIHDEL